MDKDKISIFTAALMNMNMMIGVGAFMMPPLMAQKAGFSSFLGWPLTALIIFPIVYSIAEISKIFPGAGSFYNYSKNIINRTTGFASGWMFCAGYSGVAALQTSCLRDIVREYFSIDPTLFSILFVSLMAGISLLKFSTVGKIQSMGTLFKLIPLIFVLLVFWAYINPGLSINTQNLFNVPFVVPLAIFGFWGFECCCTISHLIKGGPNAASKAIMWAFFTSVTIYTVFNFGLLNIMGVDNLISYGTEDFVRFLNLPFKPIEAALSLLIPAIVAVAYANAALSVFVASSSTIHAMACENLFPFSKSISKETANKRPYIAIAVQAVLILTLIIIINSKFVLTSLSNIGVMIPYFLTLISLLVLQNRKNIKAKMIITIIAIGSWSIATYLSWLTLGTDNFTRLTALAPLLIIFVIGICLFLINKRNDKEVRTSN